MFWMRPRRLRAPLAQGGFTWGVILLVAAVLLSDRGGANAQILDTKELVMPGNKTLQVLQAFYVYAQVDSPDASGANPFVQFQGLAVEGSGISDTYRGMQLSLINYAEFWNLINPERFCCDDADVAAGVCDGKNQLLVRRKMGQTYKNVGVFSHTVRVKGSVIKPLEEKYTLRKSGIYVLAFSNCGDYVPAVGTVTAGTVMVKNSYGFLPGNEIHKLSFYGWLAVIYIILAISWLLMSLRWWKGVGAFQSVLTAVIALGLFESIAFYLFLYSWNSSGYFPENLFFVASFLSVVLSTVCYTVILVASLGYGSSKPVLDDSVLTKLRWLCAFSVIFGFIRKLSLSLRGPNLLSPVFVIPCLMPYALIEVSFFWWSFSSLSDTIFTLEERKQDNKLVLFQHLRKVLIGSAMASVLAMTYHVIDLSHGVSKDWGNEWLYTGGVSHSIFLAVLVSMMYLFKPSEQGMMFASYAQVAGDVEDSKRDKGTGDSAVWQEDFDDDSADLWSQTTKKKGDASLAPDTIGASAKPASSGVMQDAMKELDRMIGED